MNFIITEIQVNGNDTVAFYNGSTLVRTFSRILPSDPNFISYKYDTITIQNPREETFTFTVYSIVAVEAFSYTALNFRSKPADVQGKTVQIYNQLTQQVFQGCCGCGEGSSSGCLFLFELEQLPLNPPVVPSPGRFLVDVTGFPTYNFAISNETFNAVQDIGGLYPVLSVGSWIYFYNIEDPTNFKILQVDSYDASSAPIGLFNTTVIAEFGRFDLYGNKYCFEFTAGAGVSNQSWQQTLDQSSSLDKDNTIQGRGYNFSWTEINDYSLPVENSIEVGAFDPAGINTDKFAFYADTTEAKIFATDGVTEISVGVENSAIRINTPDVVSSTALPGYVLKLQSDGTAEFEEGAGSGTVESVGLSMPSAFDVSPSTITVSGVFNVTMSGLVTEYVAGDGSLQSLPVYVAESGLNNVTSPTSFRLGGELLESAIINTDGFFVSIDGPAGQNISVPFAATNQGTAGVANFYNYANTSRSAVIVSNEVLSASAPLHVRNSFNQTGISTVLLLEHDLLSDPTQSRSSIDFVLSSGSTVPRAARLVAGVSNSSALPAYRSNFSIDTAWSSGGTLPAFSILQNGQIKFNAYTPGQFNSPFQSLLAVNSAGDVVATNSSGFIVSVSGIAPISVTSGINPVISISQAGPTQDGFLSAAAFNTFSNKQNQILLTTVGTSGAATFDGTTLNIPQYASAVLQAGNGLSQAGNIINLGRPDLTSSDANPLTANVFISVGPNIFVLRGNKSSEIALIKNTRQNSNIANAFRVESDGGNSIEAVQNFTGTITPGFIGKTSAVFGDSNVGHAFFGRSQRYTTAYFELFGSVQIDYPSLHVVKDDRSRTTTYDEILRIERQGPGTGNVGPGIGFGAVTSYWMRFGTPSTSIAKAGSDGFAWIDPTVQTSEYIVAPTLAGVENIMFKIKGNGQAQLISYNSTASFPGAAVGVLGFDAQGNILSVSGGGGGGGTINGAYNGLSVIGDQIVLGGPLTGSTLISSNGFSLQITGNVPSTQTASFSVENTNTGSNPIAIRGSAAGSPSSTGVYGLSDSGTGVLGTSNLGVGVYGTSVNGIGSVFISQSIWGLQVETNNSSGNAVRPVMYVMRNSSSAAQNGIGGSIVFAVKSSGSIWQSHAIISKWTDANEATRTSQFEIQGTQNASNFETQFTIKGTGQIQFNKYNNPALFNGVVSSFLAVDVAGNVIQSSGGPGGGGITALTGDVFATGSGTVAATIQPGVVTYSKMQVMSASSRVLGSSSTGTAVSELTPANGLTISSSELTLGGNISSIRYLTPQNSAISVQGSYGTVDVPGLEYDPQAVFFVYNNDSSTTYSSFEPPTALCVRTRYNTGVRIENTFISQPSPAVLTNPLLDVRARYGPAANFQSNATSGNVVNITAASGAVALALTTQTSVPAQTVTAGDFAFGSALKAINSGADTFAVLPSITIYRRSGNIFSPGSPGPAPSNGFGGAINFTLDRDVSGVSTERATVRLESFWSDLAASPPVSTFRITGGSVNSAISYNNPLFDFVSTGRLKLIKYTGTTFDATPIKALGVDASGNVLTFSPTTGGGITALTGDVTASGTGSVAATISNQAVTYAKFQNVAANSFLANTTGSAASVQEISTARIPLFGSAISGTANNTTFLRGDGAWVVPPTGGGTLASLSDVQLGTLSNGQVLQYNSSTSKWENASISVLTDGDKGDITVSASGATWTIDGGVVTYSKIQNVSANSFLANTTGSAASVQEISTSRIPLFSSAISGTPSGTTFLRGDGSWATPAGGVTDGDKGDITVSGSGATWTIDNTVVTYAKIQNVTANSFLANTTGSAASVQEIATDRIPLFSSAISGTPGATTFLRGDGSWATPAGGVTDGDKGDITVSGSGATWTIDNAVVTYAKIQNVSANSFLANTTGSAASAQEISTSRIPLFSSAISGTPSGTTFLRGDGSWSTVTTGLTSVGLTMPVAFTVTNSPLTANGTIAVTAAGNSGQYVRGDGTLANFPSTGGGGGQIFYFNGNISQGTIGGSTYYQLGTAANTGPAANFTRATTGPIALFITDVNSPNHLIIPSGVWTVDAYLSETGGGSNSAEVVAVLKVYNGTTFTTVATSPIEQITNGSTPDLYTFGISVPNTVTAASDRIVIEFDIQNTNGKTVTLYTEDGKIAEVHTTYAIGLSSLNGLTANTQNFATGTAGTDFAINSAGSTHTFNLPVASASNTGKLSSADWSTFNGKANLASPAFTGTPTAPTAAGGTNTTQIATTAFVQSETNSYPAYTIRANNTASTAAPANFTYKDLGEQDYASVISWGTAPTGGSPTNSYRYRWTQIGNTVNFYFIFSTNATTGGQGGATITLPTDMPAPAVPSGFNVASYVLMRYVSITNTTQGGTGGTSSYNVNAVWSLRRNSGNTAYEFNLPTGNTNIKHFTFSGSYFT